MEKEVVYWLAIEREPISLSKLRANLLFPPTHSQLLEALASLERRSLIDKATPTLIEKSTEASETLFTLQPLVMKYVIEEFAAASALPKLSLSRAKAFPKPFRGTKHPVCDSFPADIWSIIGCSCRLPYGLLKQ